MLVRFRILVRGPQGNEWWEDYSKWVGESTYSPQHGPSPKFTGDIEAWGAAVVAWFNKSEDPSRHRTFVRAEKKEATKQ